MANSTSIWGETVILTGSNFANHFAIAYLVVSFLAFFGILYTLLFSEDIIHSGSDATLRSSAFKLRLYSMALFVLAYSLQIIDIFLHENRRRVKEGYFFTYVFFDAWWQQGDLLIMAIVCRITYFQYPIWGAHAVFYAGWRLYCTASLTTLSALALYRWSVSTARTILMLNGVSSTWTQQLLHEASVLRTGYQLLYVLLSTFIVLATVYYIGRRTAFRQKPNKVESHFFTLSVLLWVKAIARADIIVRYTLHDAPHPQYLSTVAEALYGLPTAFMYFILKSMETLDSQTEAKSYILREGQRTARRELDRRRIDASKGGPALPSPAQLLTEIEEKPLLYFSDRAQTSIASLTENEARDAFATHIQDVLKLREKI